MWSHIVISLLVASAFASNNPGWKENTEYVYKIRGRTLASLHEVAEQYSGIIFKADLKIHPRSDGNLQGEIWNAQYSQVHSHFEDGWNTYIPDSSVSYKPLPMSGHPFQIEMKEGNIRDLIVNKDIPNWEVNIIKSVVSQFKLDTKATDLIPSKLTTLPEEGENSAVFKTMEDTVTGKTETTYDIHPMPEYVLQSKPWIRYHFKGEGEVIEVVKHKNYSNYEELPSYHYGFGDMKDYVPATNRMGYFFIRDSISRAILVGSLKRHTVQNSYTINEIIMSPSLNDKQKGSVVSMMNVTLEEMKSIGEDIGDVPNPWSLGNLVYTYDDPKTGKPEGKKPDQERHGSSEERYQRSATMRRLRRSIEDYEDKKDPRSWDSSSGSSEEYYKREHPQMREAPEAPLLPYTSGNKGKSVKDDVDIRKAVHKIAQEIGNDYQNPEDFLRKNTLHKFTTMTTLTRLMDFDELKQVAMDLYSQAQSGPQRDTWIAFRDAVAESGTGPAFLTIQDWVQTGKIEDEEAAEIIRTMTNAVREPTTEYMKSYFEFIKDPKVTSQEYLYDSALLSYSNLVREVYVDRRGSRRQYPTRSFEKFYTDEGRKEVEETIIPYFTEQLHDAVSRADTHKIHAYIRALGNVAHRKIFAAFEPYLEGKKQASQFQRFLMVMAMDKLTETDPKVTRSVLYKIYQNSGEYERVRAAAVHQLMRTNPPAEMLQRMASYTNIDTQEHVNAAVKSSIEYAAEYEGDEYHRRRSAAEAARPLLSKKDYGIQHGGNYFRNYIFDELKLKYEEAAQYYGNEEEFYPQGFIYSIREEFGGLKRHFATSHAMISSIEEMTNVFKYQTSYYQKYMQEQHQKAQEQKQHDFSSLNIARLLNMKSEEREQFEAKFYTELHGAFYKFWSFDNHTMEKLPEDIRKFEEEIRNGKDYHYIKMTNSREMALSFPTEMGLPFLFTYDTPASVKFEGNIHGKATPEFSRDGKLHKPDTITFKTELGFTFNGKIQGRLSFTTPFDGQHYISGFDKHFQMHVPLHGTFKFDTKNWQMEAEIENKETHEGAHLFHYSTWPYTSRVDIKNFEPVSSQEHTHYIKKDNMRFYDETFGKKYTGIAMRIEIEHEREFFNIQRFGQLIYSHDFRTAFWKLWDDASIQYGQINIKLQPEKSTTRKYNIHLGYKHKYTSESKHGNRFDRPNWHQLFSTPDPSAREDSLIDTISSGINSASACVWDCSIEFHGDKTIKYSVLGGVGKSNVDPNSRAMIYYKKTSDSQDEKPYEWSWESKSYIPNTNGLDLTESFRTEPKIDTEAEIEFGENKKQFSKVEFKFKWRRSEERKEFLMEQGTYKQCQHEMSEGNYHLPACANMTIASNLLDRVNITVKYENVREESRDRIKSFYEFIKMYYYPTLEVDETRGTGQEDEFTFEARFDPDLRSVNVSVIAKDHKSTIHTIPVEEWAQKVFVAHPVFHLRSRIFGTGFAYHTYRPICVIDQTYANTFNNRTYPAPLDEHWTLLLQYMPKYARRTEKQSAEDHFDYQPEHYAAFVRKHPESSKHKEVKITFSSPETDYKVTDITLSPASGSKDTKAKVTVDGKEVEVNDRRSYDIKDGFIQIYSLPNGEVKVEVYDIFYAIYDGFRVKFTAVNGKLRDSTRGLCGPFNDDWYSDFLTSENCIARDYREFIRSFEIDSSEGQQQRRQFAGRTNQCVPKEFPYYANVISDHDAGREQRSGSSGHAKGTKFQTQYVEKGGEICFTIHPVPVCNHREHQRGSVRKSVPVHCVKKSNVAQLWKAQIDRGASPDFSHKKESRTVQMELPKSCS